MFRISWRSRKLPLIERFWADRVCVCLCRFVDSVMGFVLLSGFLFSLLQALQSVSLDPAHTCVCVDFFIEAMLFDMLQLCVDLWVCVYTSVCVCVLQSSVLVLPAR